MGHHVRGAWRGLRRSPSSIVAAVVTLALSLGASTALVAVFDRVVLNPSPFSEPDALVIVGEVTRGASSAPGVLPRAVSPLTLRQWRDQSAPVVKLEAYDPTNVTITGGEYPERISATAATPALLPLLGITPVVGRVFNAGETSVALISDQFRARTFPAGINPVGRSLTVNGERFEIVGVLPAAFTFELNPSELWIPLSLSTETDQRIRVIGRLTAPIAPQSLATRLDSATSNQSGPLAVAVMPLSAALINPAHTALPLLLLGAAITVLLTTANVGSLLLLRGMDRVREYAVRASLGATPWDIALQTLIEAHLIVAAGVAGAVLLALWVTPYVGVLASSYLGADAADLEVSWRAVSILAASAVLCAWTAGVIPIGAAIQSRRFIAGFRETITASRAEIRIRRGLVVSQTTIAFVLLAAMLLVTRSSEHLARVDPGFAHGNALTARLSVPPSAYPAVENVRRFYDDLQSDLRASLGAGRIALVDELPLTGDRGRIRVRPGAMTDDIDSVARVTGPDYFHVIGIPLLEGRDFTPHDNADAPPRVVISKALAQALFGRDDAVGREISFGADGTAAEIVGVAGDVKHRALDEGALPTVYFNASQRPSRSVHIVIRADETVSASQAVATLRANVAERDAQLPVYAVRTLREVIDASPGVPVRRVVGASFVMFAALAVVIAAVGLFGLLAHDVGRRRFEIALRVALGADPQRLQQGVMRQALGVLAPALLIGTVASAAVSPLLQPLLYGLTPVDVSSFARVAALLTIVTFLAASVPARRAARSDAAALLRGE